MTATKKKPKKRPKTAALFPATGLPTDAPHISRAEAGCRCIQCAMHRLEARRDERARKQIAAAENDPMVPGSAVWHHHNVNERGGR
jgi:hypothetical protein